MNEQKPEMAPATGEVHIGDAVTYVDRLGRPRAALVTAVWGQEKWTGTPPSLNLVLVQDNPEYADQYGRQIDRETSVVHESAQVAPGFFWR